MKQILFHKYQGTGNDFIIIDNRSGDFNKDVALIRQMCSRKFGIGSDGLILIESPDTNNRDKVDFIMDFYNPDGSQSFCGNGSRCAVAFAHAEGIVSKTCTFKAIDGVHEAKIEHNEHTVKVHIHMNDVGAIEKMETDYYTNTGSPHYIHFTDDAINFDLIPFGRKVRYSQVYEAQNGTNVNIIEPRTDDSFLMRTYERGVEDETLSCGTGVTACALTYGSLKNKNKVYVETKGGNLVVTFDSGKTGFNNIWLTGPAKKVYEGSFNAL